MFSVNYCWISILLLVTVRGTPVRVSSGEDLCEEHNCTFLGQEDVQDSETPEETVNEEKIPTILTEVEDGEPETEIVLPAEVKVEDTDSMALESEDNVVVATADILPLKDDDILAVEILPIKESADEVEVEALPVAVPCTDFEEDCNEGDKGLELISVSIPVEDLPEDTILLDQATEESTIQETEQP